MSYGLAEAALSAAGAAAARAALGSSVAEAGAAAQGPGRDARSRWRAPPDPYVTDYGRFGVIPTGFL